MILLQRTIYCVGLLLWVLYVGLCPTWVGRSYSRDDPDNPSTWRKAGVFGLQDGDGARKRSPIWSPPRAHIAAIDASVRWPWQRPSQKYHVEPLLGKVVSQLSLGVLVLGVVLRGVNWISRPRKPDLLVSVAWCVSLSQIIAWLCMIAIAPTFGSGATEGVIVVVLALGGLAGVVYGIASFRHHPREMIRLQRTLYCAGLLLWVLYVALYPTWIGRSYRPDDPENPGTWHEGGVFGLARYRSPIWSPPRADSAVIDPSVRWPWEHPSRRDHVELLLGKMVSQLSSGVLVLGIVLRGVNWISRPRKPDLLVSVAWCVSLSLIIAWLCIIAIALFTFGYAATEGVIVAVLGLGGLAGVVYGIASFWHHRSRAATAAGTSEPVKGDLPAAAVRTVQPSGWARLPKIGAGLFWFTIGTFSACCLTVAGGWVASFFRGPVVGHTVLGTPRYSFDQTPVNVATGLGILAIGWILGFVMLRFRVPRALAVGLIVGTTSLGILFALWT